MTTRIFLADEYQIVRQGLRALLEKETGLEVVGEAAKGPAVMRQVQDLAPDIVLLDLGLPELHGVEAIRQILAASPQVKIIALSIYDDRRFVVNILKAGASGYLLKDCAFEELTKAIRAVQASKTFLSPGLSDIVAQDYIEALRDSEAHFRTIFEVTTIGIALLNKDGRVVEGNPALQRMLGYSLAELVNQDVHRFYLAGGCFPVQGALPGIGARETRLLSSREKICPQRWPNGLGPPERLLDPRRQGRRPPGRLHDRRYLGPETG